MILYSQQFPEGDAKTVRLELSKRRNLTTHQYQQSF